MAESIDPWAPKVRFGTKKHDFRSAFLLRVLCFFCTLIFESVFHGLSMRAVVDPQTPPQEGSACAELVTSLRELDNLHFAE